ncbi:MAG: MATE family efflux transporter [Myxococcales bacterium]|nr:MATE family efflux transporter [Myxococcales bacterium]
MRSELRHIARLAWPNSLGMAAFMAMNVIDTICVGQLGSVAQAGVGAAHAWGLSGAVLAFGAIRAIEPMVSQAHGEGDRDAVGQALVRTLVLAVPLAAFSFAWYYVAAPGLRLLGQPEVVLPTAEVYAQAFAWSWWPALAVQVLRAFFQSLGIVRPPMIVMFLGSLAKAPLNMALMNGWGPLPALGVAGVGWASLVVELVMLAALVAITWRTLAAYWPATPLVGPRALARLFALGLPLGVQMGTEFWAFATMQMMMGQIGPDAMAAHQVALNLASVSFMLPLGVSTAAAARVGQRFGAGEEWGTTAKAAIVLGVGLQLVSGAVFWFLGPLLVQPYSSDLTVRAIAASLMPIAAAFQLFDGLQVIGFGVLRGAGDVRLPTVANLVGYYAMGLPLGYWLGLRLGHGPEGIWWGISLALAIVGTSLLFRIRYVLGRGGVRVR